MPVSSCHCNRLWAHRSRNSPYRSEIYTTGSNHDDLAFQFSARFVQSFRRYSPIIVPTTRFEHCQLSPSNHILLLLFLSHRRRFRCSTTCAKFQPNPTTSPSPDQVRIFAPLSTLLPAPVTCVFVFRCSCNRSDAITRVHNSLS